MNAPFPITAPIVAQEIVTRSAAALATAAPLIHAAMLLANRAVRDDIERECPAVHLFDVRWRDTRPMLDQREHSPASVDMAALALQFGLDCALLVRHPTLPYLVRIVD